VYIESYLGGGGSQPVGEANITPVSDANSLVTDRPSVYVSLEPYNRGGYSDIVSVTGRMRDVGSRMGVVIVDSDKLDFDNAVRLFSYWCLEIDTHVQPYFNRVYGYAIYSSNSSFCLFQNTETRLRYLMKSSYAISCFARLQIPQHGSVFSILYPMLLSFLSMPLHGVSPQ